MCKYNMASQHNSTTQSIYSLGSEERDITNMGLSTQHSKHTSRSTNGSLTCLSTDIYKWKRLRSPTIYQILPRAQDRSWGIKLNVEVHVVLLARLKSLCKTLIKQTWVQRYSARLTSELATYASVSTKGVVEFNCSKPALTQWLSCSTTTRNFFEVRWRTRVH